MTLLWPPSNLNGTVGNEVSVAILLGVGCESHDAVDSLYKHRFSYKCSCPVTSHSVPLLLKKLIKPPIDPILQIPQDKFSCQLCLLTNFVSR